MLCAARASGRAPPSLRRAQRKARSSTVVASLKGGPFCAPIGGPVWTPIDNREEGLAVRRRRGRKRATGTRAPMALPDGPNQRWSLDFVADSLSWGRRFRILCIVDDFTREALALVVDTSIGGSRMARELDQLIARRGLPAMMVSEPKVGEATTGRR